MSTFHRLRLQLAARCGALLAAVALTQLAAAQTAGRPAPALAFAYPAGGQQGTTFTVFLGGQTLEGASAAVFSDARIRAKVIGYERPLTQREINDLRESQEQLQAKRAAARQDSSNPALTGDEERRLEEIRLLLATRGNRQAAPALAETVTLEVSVPAAVVTGDHEIRLRTSAGLSNPLVFRIGPLPETTTPPVLATSARPTPWNRGTVPAARAAHHPSLVLPATINGQILPGEIDRFRFSARHGERLMFAVSARALIPYLADAVPGWFQPAIALKDINGRELGYADDFRFHPDPVLVVEIPADGTYVLEIKDALYRGREDFVYRLVAGERPLVAAALPRAVPISSPVASRAHAESARVTEVPDNDTAATAQPLVLPAWIEGRVERAGDVDTFTFSGARGARIVAEVFARRLGSPLDSLLTLTDAAGRTLAANDDHEDKGAGLLTHHADSHVELTLPEDGRYTLRLTDTQGNGGEEFGYRLRVGPPRPDFELRIVPSTINVRAGATAPVTVHALRRDGFRGDIALALQGAPSGVTLNGARIPAGQDVLKFTLTASPALQEGVTSLQVVGQATIDGETFTRRAIPADDRMQAFAYRHLVPAQELKLCVTGRGSSAVPTSNDPVSLTPGRTAKLRLGTARMRNAPQLAFELVDAPGGVSLTRTTLRGDYAELMLACDAATAKAGAAGNLVLAAFSVRPGAKDNPNARPQRTSLGFVPAIPFVIEKAAADRTP